MGRRLVLVCLLSILAPLGGGQAKSGESPPEVAAVPARLQAAWLPSEPTKPSTLEEFFPETKKLFRSQTAPSRRSTSIDAPVRLTQATPGGSQLPLGTGRTPPMPAVNIPRDVLPSVGRQSVTLQAALYGTLTSNPDLATLRLGTATTPSPEAVEVARHFPT